VSASCTASGASQALALLAHDDHLTIIPAIGRNSADGTSNFFKILTNTVLLRVSNKAVLDLDKAIKSYRFSPSRSSSSDPLYVLIVTEEYCESSFPLTKIDILLLEDGARFNSSSSSDSSFSSSLESCCDASGTLLIRSCDRAFTSKICNLLDISSDRICKSSVKLCIELTTFGYTFIGSGGFHDGEFFEKEESDGGAGGGGRVYKGSIMEHITAVPNYFVKFSLLEDSTKIQQQQQHKQQHQQQMRKDDQLPIMSTIIVYGKTLFLAQEVAAKVLRCVKSLRNATTEVTIDDSNSESRSSGYYCVAGGGWFEIQLITVIHEEMKRRESCNQEMKSNSIFLLVLNSIYAGLQEYVLKLLYNLGITGEDGYSALSNMMKKVQIVRENNNNCLKDEDGRIKPLILPFPCWDDWKSKKHVLQRIFDTLALAH
jgi:hypothetical protein